MRISGWSLVVLLVVVSTASAQPVLSDVPTSTPKSANSPVVDQKLKEHLAAWEKAMDKVVNVHWDVKRVCEDGVFKKARVFTGSFLCMKPNFFLLRLENQSDPTKQDYEACLCDGKSLFRYSGLQKTITEHTIIISTEMKANDPLLVSPKTQVKEWRRQIPDLDATDQYLEHLANYLLSISIPSLIIEKAMFLSGTKPKDLQQRFEISLLKEDANYVYVNLKPKNQNDIYSAKQISMALYGPKTDFAYFPAKIIVLFPNDDTDTWDFTKLHTNIPGINEESFRYAKVPGFREISAPHVPATNTPDKPVPIGPEVPSTETSTAPTNTPSIVECPNTPSCCCEKRFGWRLFRNCR